MTSEARQRKMADRIKVIVAEMLERRVKDPRLGFVTVTGVVTTSDLAQATVWLSVYGGEKRRLGTLAALEGAAGILQARVNSQLHLRRTPQLLFEYDQSVEHGGGRALAFADVNGLVYRFDDAAMRSRVSQSPSA